MNDGLISQRYAKALYKYAVGKNNAAAVYSEMKEVIKSFEDNPGLSKVLANPYICRDDKQELLISAARDKVEDNYRNFVALVLDNNREDYAYLMALSYRQIYRVENKISQVEITTAAALADKEMENLRRLVEKAFPETTLEFTYKINPDIIGGFVINVDSVRMDASLSNEIEQLRLNLLRSN